MNKIVLADGTVFEGASAADIVSKLHMDDWTNHSTADDYKQNMKQRVRKYNGKRLRYRTDEEFLKELQRVGFIKFIISGT